ncbi:hypothetical protein [Lacrimispora sp.]|uniref:hypothetical protein n=1 Tax=Lacrimispora sp. TaxID=2719234 RepID=UPI0032E41DFD
MRIAICDDDTSIVGKIEMLILEHQHLINVKFEIYAFYSGEELLSFVHALNLTSNEHSHALHRKGQKMKGTFSELKTYPSFFALDLPSVPSL